MHVWLFLGTVVIASAVEMVETMTILLASGLTRGWRSTIEGAVAALLPLTGRTRLSQMKWPSRPCWRAACDDL